MATTEEKRKGLVELLGPVWAEFVLKQAEATEKAGDDRGIASKERREGASFSGAPEYCANPATGIGAVLRGE